MKKYFILPFAFLISIILHIKIGQDQEIFPNRFTLNYCGTIYSKSNMGLDVIGFVLSSPDTWTANILASHLTDYTPPQIGIMRKTAGQKRIFLIPD